MTAPGDRPAPRPAGTATAPTIGLLADDVPDPLRALLVALRHRARVRYAGPGGVTGAAAYVVRGDGDDVPADTPYAYWVDGGAPPDPARVDGARALLTGDLATAT